MIPAAIPLQAQYILDFQRTLSAAGDNVPSMLDETQVYIGLNDADTKEQLYETKAYVSLLRELCHSYKVPFLSTSLKAATHTTMGSTRRRSPSC